MMNILIMRKLSKFILISLILISVFLALYQRPSINGNAATDIIEETALPPELYFCPQYDCINVLTQMANKSQKIECAIYDIKDKTFIEMLEQKKAKVYTDKDYAKNLAGYSIEYKTNKYYLMHDKFCIFDDAAIYTGSFNAVKNLDDNNVFIIYSKNLAKNYADEFNELWDGKYPQKTLNPKVRVNGMLFESYFCPEDWCANKIIAELNQAKKSIAFMTFSFTHDDIGNLLIEKKNNGLNISGIMEKSQATTNYSEYSKFKAANVDVILDSGKELMHHKVFIIDNNTVITGSMNPTQNGDTKNDENILIIHNEEVTKRFLAEFERLRKI